MTETPAPAPLTSPSPLPHPNHDPGNHAVSDSNVAAQGRHSMSDLDNLLAERDRLESQAATARAEIERLHEHYWLVPKIGHDPNAAVGPTIFGPWIHRDQGDSNPDHTRHYAAQLLAAADAVEQAEEFAS